MERGDIRDAIDASGQVNAVVSVQVGSQVSGTIAKLNVDFNSHVTKDEIVALIDQSLFQGALLQANADLAAFKANVAAAKANLAKAKASAKQTSDDFGRMSQLAKTGAATGTELSLATANYEAATASVDAARAGLVQARAQMDHKAAAVAVAQTNLDHTVIRSPIEGVIVARSVDVGQTVAASLRAPTIFTIAQDLTKMQLYAKLDESDVGRNRLNEPVTFKVDAFPKETSEGSVSQIRMNPTTVQNVVTYDAIINFAQPGEKGLSGNDCLRDDPRGDGNRRHQGSERRPSLYSSASARRAAGALHEVRRERCSLRRSYTVCRSRDRRGGRREIATVWKRCWRRRRPRHIPSNSRATGRRWPIRHFSNGFSSASTRSRIGFASCA
ncbi:MAG: efflux RND transporter periplasmic adaptor subunit [Gemmatimonadaceae bacterium]